MKQKPHRNLRLLRCLLKRQLRFIRLGSPREASELFHEIQDLLFSLHTLSLEDAESQKYIQKCEKLNQEITLRFEVEHQALKNELFRMDIDRKIRSFLK